MKILIVNNSDIDGGAARAANRLHKALLNENIDSQMLVINKFGDDYTVNSSNQNFGTIKNQLRKLQARFFNPIKQYRNRAKTIFSPSYLCFSNIYTQINNINPDIVHLHWICHEMIKIEDLKKINAAIVWSLHDDWAYTGGCHIKWKCEKYKESCGSCPNLTSNKQNDLSRKVFKRKQNIYSQIHNMTIVGLSRWITSCAKQSALLKSKNIITIPNLLDIELFKPLDRNITRNLWQLPKDKKLILFGACNATSDINKGFSELKEALCKLNGRNIEFVVYGSSEPEHSQTHNFKTHYLGHLHDDVSLVALYNACDVMVVPSLQEAFGQTASEAMACGTPVTAFNSTGLVDIVDHKLNGYLATPFDTSDLARGIDWILNAKNYNTLCLNARNKVLQCFDSKIVSKQYIELYTKILN